MVWLANFCIIYSWKMCGFRLYDTVERTFGQFGYDKENALFAVIMLFIGGRQCSISHGEIKMFSWKQIIRIIIIFLKKNNKNLECMTMMSLKLLLTLSQVFISPL